MDFQSVNTFLDTIQQKPQDYGLEPFVGDFLRIWLEIHQQAVDATLDDLMTISRKIYTQHVLSFYDKYSDNPALRRVEPWEQSYSSIVLRWENRGSYLFPLNLVTYEVCYHHKSRLYFYLKRLETRDLPGTQEALFEFLFPILTNFIVPLDNIDIGILKASIILEKSPSNLFRAISHSAYTSHVEMSSRNVIRRLNRLDLLEVFSAIYFPDMGQLGYETTLFFHTSDFPKEMEDYLLLSACMQIGTFSVVQIPYKKVRVMQRLQESLESVLVYPLTRRIANWNLSGFIGGEDPWHKPPSLLHGNPRDDLISASPRMDMSLEPSMNHFPLSPADIKILDFLSTQGSFRNLKSLSKTINVSVKTISKALQKYNEHQLLLRMNQFFNIGLDLSLFFFLSIEDESIPWIDHFLTFPKVDVFMNKDDSVSTYFGSLKLPNKWIKEFSRNMERTTRDLRGKNLKFYYKIFTPLDHFKWGIQLQKTL